MRQCELSSEMAVADAPRSEDDVYHLAVLAAIDMRALQVEQDWFDELWDLVMDIRQHMEPCSPMGASAAEAMKPQIMTMLDAMDVSRKSGRRIDSEHRQQQARVLAFRDRLLRVMRGAWPASDLQDLEPESYHDRARLAGETMMRRLEILDQVRVKPEEAAEVAGDFMNMMVFWQNLDRPSTPKERERAEGAFVRFRSITARNENYFQQRDQVIFRWKDPVPFSPDVKAIRKELSQMLEEGSRRSERSG